MKHKLLNIIIFAGIILAFKACIIVCCCQKFCVNDPISSETNCRNLNYIIIKDFIEEPNIQNLPGIKVEPIQIRFFNEHKIVFLYQESFTKIFSIKYTDLPDKIFKFTQRNLQVSYLSKGVLLI